MEDPRVRAEDNFYNLQRNFYPGRLIIIGASEDANSLIQLYALTGRRENSRNRVFSLDGSRVFTEPADPTKVQDPSLIIYDAMLEDENGDVFVVTNGKHTNKILEDMSPTEDENLYGLTFNEALQKHTYEPDKPNNTPRIAGACSFQMNVESMAELGVIRKSPWGTTPDRMTYQYESVAEGFGYSISTYMGDGDPLPVFQGEPIILPLRGDIQEVAKTYWEALNAANRIALAVKFIEIKTGKSTVELINKYNKVIPPEAA